MRSIGYDIHGAVRVSIEGLSPFAVRAFNCPHDYFRASPGAGADIRVEAGPFEPDLNKCRNVDHKYFVREDYLYFRERDKGLAWEAEISGLAGRGAGMGAGPLRVRWHAPLRNRLRFPWGLFPELILHLHVLQPLMDLVLRRKGYCLLHSAAVEKDGKALLIAGRGGAHKTTFVMSLLRRGYRLLGDDMVILKEGRVFAYPTIIDQLEYLARHADVEDMGLPQHARLFAWLLRKPERRIPVAASAVPGAVNVVLTRDIPAPRMVEGWDRSDLVASLASNHLMERITYFGFKYSTAAFLEAYAYAFPESGLQGLDAALPLALSEGLGAAPFRVIEVPLVWDARNLDLLLSETSAVAPSAAAVIK